MKVRKNYHSRKGVLTFEWMLLIVILVTGIVGGMSVIRDALVVESAETAAAIMNIDPSYQISSSLSSKLHFEGMCCESSYITGSQFSAYKNTITVSSYDSSSN